MSVLVRDEQRRLVPRWRDSKIAATTAEVTALPAISEQPTIEVDTASVEAAVADWRAAPSLGTAADAVAVGFVLGSPDLVRAPAEYLVEHESEVSRIGSALARRVLGLPGPVEVADGAPAHVPRKASHRRAVATLRARLIRTPRDPLAYLDIARRYAALGQNEAAASAMRRALALAPDNRLVLRSASRFFVHNRDPEQAQEILRRSPRTRSDPWLMAAEISAATVTERTSRLIKRGRDLVSRASLPPVHLSELAAALGTVDMIDGNVRNARRLFEQAMTAPTDNSLAQAEWMVPRIGLRDLPPLDSVPRSYEAAALSALREGDWPRALDASYQWLDDEPFSHKSAVMGSFIAATGPAEFGEAIVIATEGLIANPDVQLLRNNLVFALASDGQLDRAVAELGRVRVADMDSDTRIAWTATVGLLNYSLGQLELGRAHYQTAVDAAERQSNEPMAIMGALNWATAALYAREPDAEQLREAALLRASTSADPAIVAVRARLIALSPHGEYPAQSAQR